MTARLLVRALWRRKLVAILLFVLTVVSTNAYLASVPRIYTATASVAIVPGQNQTGFGEISGPLLGTLVDQARGNDVLKAAREPVPGAPSLGALRGATTVQAVTGAFTLRISVALQDPAMAATLANRIAGTLPRFNLAPDRVSYRAVNVALPPSEPSSPQRRLVLAVGVLLGLALGVAAALLLDDARRRVEGGVELSEATGAALLATIPRPRDPGSIVTDDEQQEILGLRSLRIGLGSGAEHAAVVVAGLAEADDDGWLAVNTAVCLAAVRNRVLLVQADPSSTGPVPSTRQAPTAAAAAGGSKQGGTLLTTAAGGGLVQALRGADVAALLRPGPVPGLSVLAPGEDPAALPALLESAYPTLIAKLTADFDAVVVHAPPLAASDDARVLAAEGVVLLWTRPGETAVREVQARVSELSAVRARVAGCVLLARPAGRLRRKIPTLSR